MINFRVAVLQMHAQIGNPEKNVELIIQKLKEGAENKADLLLLPECFITGYMLPIDNKKALADDDTYIKEVCNAAKKYQVGIVATALTQGKNKAQNSAFVINKSGKIIMKYAKVHTCDFADEACLESGNEFKVCELDGVKLGVMICYDREYPESARILMLKGAEIILVPNDCEAMRPRVQALSTRAYENMVGIAMANPNGKNAGCSCAFTPICWNKKGECIDNTLFIADASSEKLYFADFDLVAIRHYRSQEMMGNTFRKVNAYAELLKAEVKPPFIRLK